MFNFKNGMPNLSREEAMKELENYPGPKCSVCKAPLIVAPPTALVANCMICNYTLVKRNEIWISVEELIDPDKILEREDLTEFSPEFTQLINRDKEKKIQDREMFLRGMGLVQTLGWGKPWIDLMEAKMRNYEVEEAIYAALKALHWEHQHWGLWLNLIELLYQMLMLDAAETVIEVVRACRPGFQPLEGVVQRYQDANIIRVKYADKPKYFVTLFNLGSSHAQTGKFHRAIKKYTRVIEMHPTDINTAMVWGHLGLVYRDMADFAQAEKAFEQALKLNPKEAKVCIDYASLALVQKNFEKAKKWVKEAIKLEPNNLEYKNRLEELEKYKDSR